MGGGMAGNFGGTAGNSREKILDSLSNLLTAASLIPGLDTFADLASIPVDLARGDIVSAGLSALGVIPFVGEVADTAKIARVADKAIDSGKTIKKATSVTNNVKSVAKKFKLNKSGYFGDIGKNTRVFRSADPIKSSADFYNRLSKNGKKTVLANGKGVQTVFDDGSRVVYRVVTKTPNSPAVEITVSSIGKIKSQKIHFIK